MGKIKAIFIDIDNTILDFDILVKKGLRDIMEKFRLGTYEDWMYDVFTQVNTKLWRRIEDGDLDIQGLRKIRFCMIFEKIGVPCENGEVYEEYFRQFIHDHADLIPGAYEFMERLSEKYILCVASNGPYEQQVHRIHLAHMEEFVSHYCISEKYGVSKPAKEFFDKALEELPGISPEECIMIGDSETSDIQGGKNAGMKMTIFFNKRHEKDLSYVTADCCFDTLKEIEDFILSMEE